MKYFILILALGFFSSPVFSQGKHTKHTKHIVTEGETISGIAEQYDVKASAIYEINPEARKTLHLKQVLLIPNLKETKIKKGVQEKATVEGIVHHVLAKETVYGIVRQYGITTEALKEANPTLDIERLKIDQIIMIPVAESNKKKSATNQELPNIDPKNNVVKADVSKEEKTNLPQSIVGATDLVLGEGEVIHEVLQKETKYTIAKHYQITIKALTKANPVLETKVLEMGQKIIIPVKEVKKNNSIVEKQEAKTVSKNSIPNAELPKAEPVLLPKSTEINGGGTIIVHEVMPKETKYGIAKRYGISVANLEKQNPDIANGLPVGVKLNIQPSNSENEKEAVAAIEKVTVVKNEKGTIIIKDSLGIVKSYDPSDLALKLIRTASEKLGTRYRSGGTTTEGFDCSGLMFNTFGTFAIKLPRSSFEQSFYGAKINTNEAQKGDLIFFKTNGRGQINHVGMVVEVLDGEIKFIHSANHGGVIVSSTKESYYEKNLVQVNRVL
ncbi:peptidoglycan endopeptidase [Flavobacterium psychrotolerans]|uniref:Peptidoglycan endopeptidase n=1 Tax=Flavobacterium psychrotolerans TaxID=2169410 RepID=A0A2U1JH40_9FLAO|nr:peptidoglycan endopeptidase [Flavobacterium psychrotolerans]PWA04183.1 peptidoglycan endopeptidase [Flavobacterium psychrotolerans]